MTSADQVSASATAGCASIDGADVTVGKPKLSSPPAQHAAGVARILEQELAADGDAAVVEIHPNVANLYRRKVTELQTLLVDETTRSQAVDAIRALIERIEVRAGASRGQAKVTLVGALASILAYACAQKKTAVSGGDGGRVLVVAGAGFGRERTWSEIKIAV